MKVIVPFLLMITGLTMGAFAQIPLKLIPLWEDGPPACNEEMTLEVKMDDRIGRRIGKVQNPGIQAFPAPAKTATGTAVVICPGGGYTIQAWDWEGTKIAKWFNDQGISAFVLQYRLPHWMSDDCHDKAALADAQRAIRLVRSKAKEYQINPDKIGIMGFSAGGHLASTAGTRFTRGNPQSDDPVERESCRPDFMILMYPVVTMDPAWAHMGSRKNLIGENPPESAVLHFSNEKQITSETPPTILIHANDDKSVVPENSIHFYLNLRKQGVPAAMHIFETGGHGFSFAEGLGAVEKWPGLVLDWMKGQGF